MPLTRRLLLALRDAVLDGAVDSLPLRVELAAALQPVGDLVHQLPALLVVLELVIAPREGNELLLVVRTSDRDSFFG